MSLRSEENGLRYVYAFSTPSRTLRLKKVNVEDSHVEGVGHVIRCKRVSSLRNAMQKMKDQSNSDDVELTVVSASENDLPADKNIENDEICEEPPSKKLNSEPSLEHNSIKIKAVQESKMSNAHSLTCSNSSTSFCQNSSPDDDDSEYISLSTYNAKRAAPESQERRHAKYKVFRDEWLDIDIFRDWLDRDPTNPRRARCVACNTTMNAGKSELEKHAAGARHERAVEAMHQSIMLQQLTDAEAGEQEVGDLIDDEESSNDMARPVNSPSFPETTQPVVMEQTVNPEEIVSWHEQQTDAMNRVATAVESLSGNIVLLLERLSSQQRELISALHELAKK